MAWPAQPRTRLSGVGSWTIESILATRQAQMRGHLARPAALAVSLKSDAAIYSALLNLLAPHRGLPRAVHGPESANQTIRAEAEMTFARDTTALCPAALADAFEALALHGLGVMTIDWKTREDGTRCDPVVSAWPAECIDFEEHTNRLVALTDEGRVPIVHGDGKWIVVHEHEQRPWTWGALVPLSLLYADRQFGVRDRSRSAESHGDDKWIGTLPEGVPISSPMGQGMLDELVKLYDARRVMIKPFGSEVERVEAMAQNWQIFKELIESCDRDAQKILLGQDGTMSNAGGNYIKSWGLFGVRNDIVEAQLSAMSRALTTGLLRPWSMINFGRWDRLEYRWLIPDADDDARREAIAKRYTDFFAIVKEMRESGCVVDQSTFDRLGTSLGLETVPNLADASPAGAAFYAYELEGGVVTIDEVRASKGLPPLPNGRGQLTVPEARAAAANAPSPPATPLRVVS